MSNVLSGSIMKDVDDTTPPEAAPTNEQLYELCKDYMAVLEILMDLPDKVRELEAKVEDLHNDRAVRLQQIDLEDPEWF